MKWNWKWWKKKPPFYLDSKNDLPDGAYFKNPLPASMWNNLIDYVSQISGGDFSNFELKDDHDVDINNINALIKTLEPMGAHQADIKAIVDQLIASKTLYDNQFNDVNIALGTKETTQQHDADIDALNKRIDDLPTGGGGTGDVTRDMLNDAVNQLQANIDTKETLSDHNKDIITLETKADHQADISSILATTSSLYTKNEAAALKSDITSTITDFKKEVNSEYAGLALAIDDKMRFPNINNRMITTTVKGANVAGSSYELTIPLHPGGNNVFYLNVGINRSVFGTTIFSSFILIEGVSVSGTNSLLKVRYEGGSVIYISVDAANTGILYDIKVWRLN